MPYKALVFGAIGVMAETSEIQREAYNLAFKQSGLDWYWNKHTYKLLLQKPGGLARVARFAESRGEVLDAEAVHARKVANFRAAVMRQGLTPRPGVLELMRGAERRGRMLAWATTTGPATMDLMFDGFGALITRDRFAYLGDRTHVEHGKPQPDIYLRTLIELGLEPHEVLAIEDTPESAAAARAAGLDVIGFPGLAAAGRGFPPGTRVVDRLRGDLALEMQAA